MAIKETTKKIHFTEFIPGRKKLEVDASAPTVTVSVKYNQFTLPNSTILEMGLEGKLIKLFYEPAKRIIGFKIIDKAVGQEELKTLKLVKLDPTLKHYKFQLGKMLSEFQGLKQDSYKHLPIHKYVERQDKIGGAEVYFYVQLKEPMVEGEEETEE